MFIDKPIVVLSLFDGMSCGQIALRDMGIPITKVYASEIDKHAIKQTQLNFPCTIQLGDVEKWREWDIDWGSVDLLLAGSPCQGFSLAGKMLGHDDPRSKLYWVFLDILHHAQKYNPNVKFLLENVRMRPDDERKINESIGMMPVVINSALISAQNRVRLYWTNIRTRQDGLFGEVSTDIPQPDDRGILIQDILEESVDEKYFLSPIVWSRHKMPSDTEYDDDCEVIKLDKKLKPKPSQGKASCLTAGGHSGGNQSDMDILAISSQGPHNENLGIYQKGRGYVAPSIHMLKSPTLTSNSWQENNMICAMRGRGESNEQTIEVRRDSKSNTLTSVAKDDLVIPGTWRTHKEDRGFREVSESKSPCIPARARNDGSGQPCVRMDRVLRRLTPTECARLQTIPEWYRWECSDTQAYKMLGNGWTVEVIKHILSFL